jgi:hypothetical protein
MRGFGSLSCRRAVSLLCTLTVVVGLAAAVEPAATAASASTPIPVASSSQSAPPVASRPDVVSARLAAAGQGSRVEVSSLEDEYSDTYANPDGTLTTESSIAPLRVLRDGAWVAVDYDLQHVNGSWSPKASAAPVVFSDGGDTDAASVGTGSKQVALSWAVTLPAPVITGPTATYDLGDGESLVLTATPAGLSSR